LGFQDDARRTELHESYPPLGSSLVNKPVQPLSADEETMSDVIVSDPEILGGRRVFRGTRVPVEVLFENLEDGLSIDEIIASYPSLNREDVIACLEEACATLKV